MRLPVRGAFILKVSREGPSLTLRLQDLRTGQLREFRGWEALRKHLEAVTQCGSLR